MMTRTEVAKKFDVSYETIRNWERKGILVIDFLSPTGKKFFSEEQINSLYARTYGLGDKKE